MPGAMEHSGKAGSSEPALVEQLARILCRPVGANDRERAAIHLRDWLSCAFLGSRSEAGELLSRYGARQAAGECLAIGAGGRSAEAAAFVNGGLGNIFEMDDVHGPSIIHPGDTVIPAALAVAEREACSGEELLSAVVRGYEAAIRVGLAAGVGHYKHWYSTATCGVFGAAAAAGSILKLDPEATAQALANAGMQSSGPWQCRIGPNFGKQLATAHAARSGIVAADLAAIGFTGPHHILEGVHGLLAATNADGLPAAVGEGIEGPWKIWESSFKPWPSCRVTHPVIEAALIARAGIDLRGIESIEIETFQQAIDMCDQPLPTTPHEGRFSLQHCVAIALLIGEPKLIHFDQKWLHDENVSSLRNRISARARADLSGAFPNRLGAALKISPGTGDPQVIELPVVKGDPGNPLTEGELVGKARDLLDYAGASQPAIDHLLESISSVCGRGDLAELTGAIRAIAAETNTSSLETRLN